MKNPKLILASFWPLKLIETLITYFNDKIKPKPSPDGTLSPNTILFSDGRYCTVLASASLQRDFRDGLANGFWQVREGTKKEHHPI